MPWLLPRLRTGAAVLPACALPAPSASGRGDELAGSCACGCDTAASEGLSAAPKLKSPVAAVTALRGVAAAAALDSATRILQGRWVSDTAAAAAADAAAGVEHKCSAPSNDILQPAVLF